jgi:hypothetical protein
MNFSRFEYFLTRRKKKNYPHMCCLRIRKSFELVAYVCPAIVCTTTTIYDKNKTIRRIKYTLSIIKEYLEQHGP